jgi:hypothetical protein
MKQAYAKCRDYEEGDSFPYYDNRTDRESLYCPCDNTLYECWQPDCIEDDDFNLVIMMAGYPVLARECHFDFV